MLFIYFRFQYLLVCFFFVSFVSPTSIKRNFDSPKRCIQRFNTRTLNDNGGIAVYTLQCQRSIGQAYRVD